MNKPSLPSYVLTATSLLSALAAQGQVLFQDNFDSTPASAWTVIGRSAGDSAIIGFDYSTLGIPAAPNSGGTTIGAILYANQPGAGVPADPTVGVSIFPTGQSFSGDYELRYDVWQNFPGPYPAGGAGSTQLTGAGINASGTVPVYAGAGDALWFGATGDGGSAQDYRLYFNNTHQTATSIYAAGSQNAAAQYYIDSGFGSVPVGAETTGAGTQGMEWHSVLIAKNGNTVTWSIDGITIATADISAAGPFGGANIVFLQSDINSGQTTEALEAQLFGLIDNVVVAVPEPSTYALLGLGGAFLFSIARRKRS
jgi:hypothetical protein